MVPHILMIIGIMSIFLSLINNNRPQRHHVLPPGARAPTAVTSATRPLHGIATKYPLMHVAGHHHLLCDPTGGVPVGVGY